MPPLPCAKGVKMCAVLISMEGAAPFYERRPRWRAATGRHVPGSEAVSARASEDEL